MIMTFIDNMHARFTCGNQWYIDIIMYTVYAAKCMYHYKVSGNVYNNIVAKLVIIATHLYFKDVKLDVQDQYWYDCQINFHKFPQLASWSDSVSHAQSS